MSGEEGKKEEFAVTEMLAHFRTELGRVRLWVVGGLCVALLVYAMIIGVWLSGYSFPESQALQLTAVTVAGALVLFGFGMFTRLLFSRDWKLLSVGLHQLKLLDFVLVTWVLLAFGLLSGGVAYFSALVNRTSTASTLIAQGYSYLTILGRGVGYVHWITLLSYACLIMGVVLMRQVVAELPKPGD